MAKEFDLTIDPDVQDLLNDIFSEFAEPTVEANVAQVWETLKDAGFARLTAPEEQGGSGAGWAEAQALVRTAARFGVAVPYAETDLLVGSLRRAVGLDDTSCEMATFGVLGASGIARNVPWAGATDTIVLARKNGDTWQIADVSTKDLSIEKVQGISADPLGNVSITGTVNWVDIPALELEKTIAKGALLRAIACCGALEGMIASAIEHTTSRQQFGRPVARFQSVQNLVVDAVADSLLATSATDSALVAWALAENENDYKQALYRIAIARSVVAKTVGLCVRNTHQAHGAIGTTHEHTLHRKTLPALQWRTEFGSPALWESALQELALQNDGQNVWELVSEGGELPNVPALLLTSCVID